VEEKDARHKHRARNIPISNNQHSIINWNSNADWNNILYLIMSVDIAIEYP